MNIDKFGHHVHKRLRLSEYCADNVYKNALVKSLSGVYDLQSTRLTGLTDPKTDDEAVNKAYVDKEVENLLIELKKINGRVQIYLKELEKATSEHLRKSMYTKAEVDHLIESKLNKNE